MTRPRPCPFCGGRAVAVPGLSCCAVMCRPDNPCALHPAVSRPTTAEAVEVWNRRPAEAPLRAALARAIQGFSNLLEFDLIPETHRPGAESLLADLRGAMPPEASAKGGR